MTLILPENNGVYVWLVTKNDEPIAKYIEVSSYKLKQLVKSIRLTVDFAEMGDRLTPFQSDASADLYKLLLGPFESGLAGKNHIIVAAGGELGQIPFGLLLTKPTTKATKNPDWLIRRMAITHIPSINAWLATKQIVVKASATEAFIAWGDPKFGGKQLISSDSSSTRHITFTRAVTDVDLDKEGPRSALKYSNIPELPETRDELFAIASALRADPQLSLHLGSNATKESVVNSSKSGELLKKRVVVFATHGLMAGDLPHLTQPALALASTGNETIDPLGALLKLDEVLNLKLNADWVILSACNTAAADGKADEALSGLARGFFYAGSRSLLVTHWAVESESAMQLTTKTMKHYTANPTERKAESLRQAMLEVMSNPEYSHPAYWAPYALVGDGGR